MKPVNSPRVYGCITKLPLAPKCRSQASADNSGVDPKRATIQASLQRRTGDAQCVFMVARPPKRSRSILCINHSPNPTVGQIQNPNIRNAIISHGARERKPRPASALLSVQASSYALSLLRSLCRLRWFCLRVQRRTLLLRLLHGVRTSVTVSLESVYRDCGIPESSHLKPRFSYQSRA